MNNNTRLLSKRGSWKLCLYPTCPDKFCMLARGAATGEVVRGRVQEGKTGDGYLIRNFQILKGED